MPSKRTRVVFITHDGSPKSFLAKKKRSPARSLKALNQRLKKLKSPKMRANAREKWLEARS